MQKKISSVFQKHISVATENAMSYSNAVIRIHQNGDSVHLHRDNSNFEIVMLKKSKENITIKIGAEPRAIGYIFV